MLAVLGVALGMAVMIAIRLANIGVIDSFRAAIDAVSGGTSLPVLSKTGPFDERLVRDLAWLQQYGSVSPVLEEYVMVATNRQPERTETDSLDRNELLYVLGVDVLRDLPLRKYSLLQVEDTSQEVTPRQLLDLLVDDRAVILTEQFARQGAYRIGDTISLAFGSRVKPLTVRGCSR